MDLKSISKFLAIIASTLLITACAGSSSIFYSYTGSMRVVKEDISNYQYAPAVKKLKDGITGDDKQLYLLESGRITQIAGHHSSSEAYFKNVIQLLTEQEEQAEYRISSGARQVGAVFLNDNAIPYEIAPYEKIMLHQFQAFNYLDNNNIEAAGVEIRRANALQNEMLEKFSNELDEAEKEAAKKHIELGQFNSVMQQNMTTMDAVAGRVKNQFQNAYTFYASAVLHEIMGNPNDAYIDYKKAVEIFPQNSYLQDDILRLAKKLNFKKEYRKFNRQFGRKSAKKNSKNNGELVVFFEEGFVSEKQQLALPIPTVHGLVPIAIPYYNSAWQSPLPLTVFSGGKSIGKSEPIVYVESLAVKELKEHIMPIVTRQFIRAVIKYQLTKELHKNGGTLGLIIGSIANAVTEQADLRSWLTLPHNAQIVRKTLKKGKHKIGFKYAGSAIFGLMDVDINPGQITLVRVIETNGKLHLNNLTKIKQKEVKTSNEKK